jgi:hypothetical protein
MEKTLALLSVLEGIVCNTDIGEMLTMELFSDGSGTIYYKDDNDEIATWNAVEEMNDAILQAVLERGLDGE